MKTGPKTVMDKDELRKPISVPISKNNLDYIDARCAKKRQDGFKKFSRGDYLWVSINRDKKDPEWMDNLKPTGVE